MKAFVLGLAAAFTVVSGASDALAQSPPPPPPPISAYAAFPSIDHVTLSPDGLKIAWIGLTPTGERAMVVRTLAGESLGAVNVDSAKVRDLSWADNDHVVITTSQYSEIAFFTDTDEFWTAQSYNIRTRRFVQLLNRTTNTGGGTTNRLHAAGTGELNVIGGPPFQHRVGDRVRTFVYSLNRSFEMVPFEVDLDTGVGTLRESFDGVMGPTGEAVAREDWDKDAGRWWVSAKAAVGWRNIWSRTGFTVDWPSLLGYGRTADTVLISVPASPTRELYEVTLTTGAAERLSVGSLRAPGPIYHPLDGRLLGFSSLEGDAYRYVFTDAAIATAWASVREAYPDERIELSSHTPDFSRFVIRRETDDNAGSFSLVDLEAGSAINLGVQYPGLANGGLSEVRFITYSAADGRQIPAYLTLPYGRDPRDLPLVVMPHGGPQARDMPGFDDWSQAIASRGYAVLRPQFRGSTGFGVAHTEAGYGQWGRLMQTDLTDGVHYLRDEGIIDPARVCIFGWSYGGYAAMAGVTLDPDTYRCAVAGAGLSDLPAFLDWVKDRGAGHDSVTMRYWRRFMGATESGNAALGEISPARLADRVRAPVMLIHGRDDSVVPFDQSERFQRALVRAGKPVELVEIRGEDHWMSSAPGRRRVSEALIGFLQTHNPPD